jgi:hypothetical protein
MTIAIPKIKEIADIYKANFADIDIDERYNKNSFKEDNADNAIQNRFKIE